MLPNSLRAKRFAAVSVFLNWYEVVRYIGTATAVVAGSLLYSPPWRAIVSGFLIVAYSAGSEIPKFLSAMITTLFFVFSMIVVFGGYETFFAAHNYSRIFGPSYNTLLSQYGTRGQLSQRK